ncbi:hypothetical protein Pmani_031984 [Petrolisthes manimaculis]|uniref:Uncharacterized protein n=1 Tax=Petrolisthes manimaculis TaxID=1843537 RepID=A0AAE1NSL6_9EUCA|nr:hypothetical protein Pmani_031984 [Petrolisthes manimaculis]
MHGFTEVPLHLHHIDPSMLVTEECDCMDEDDSYAETYMEPHHYPDVPPPPPPSRRDSDTILVHPHHPQVTIPHTCTTRTTRVTFSESHYIDPPPSEPHYIDHTPQSHYIDTSAPQSHYLDSTGSQSHPGHYIDAHPPPPHTFTN